MIYIYIIGVTQIMIIIVIWWNFIGKAGPIVEKWSLKASESSLELEIMEPFDRTSVAHAMQMKIAFNTD